jgi:hypothetical protein
MRVVWTGNSHLQCHTVWLCTSNVNWDFAWILEYTLGTCKWGECPVTVGYYDRCQGKQGHLETSVACSMCFNALFQTRIIITTITTALIVTSHSVWSCFESGWIPAIRTTVFSGFAQAFRGMLGYELQVRYDNFLPNPASNSSLCAT